MTDSNRIILIGAGHNGLVCAAYLAKAGRDVANDAFLEVARLHVP